MIALPAASRILAALAMLVLLAASLVAAGGARAQDVTELLLRLDRLEAENRRLTGLVEQMQFRLQRVEEQAKTARADTDARLSALESDTGAPPPEAAAIDPAAPRSAPTPPAEADAGAPATGERPDQGRTPRQAYEAAVAMLESEDYADAELAFREFIAAHPKDRLVAAATFGLGESLFRRERYADAAEHYLEVTNKYPKAQTAPEAMLKLGMSLARFGAKDEACSTLAEVVKTFPEASQDVRRAVERQRRAAACG